MSVGQDSLSDKSQMVLLAEEYPVTYLNTEVFVIEVNRFFKKKKANNDKMGTNVFQKKSSNKCSQSLDSSFALVSLLVKFL